MDRVERLTAVLAGGVNVNESLRVVYVNRDPMETCTVHISSEAVALIMVEELVSGH